MKMKKKLLDLVETIIEKDFEKIGVNYNNSMTEKVIYYKSNESSFSFNIKDKEFIEHKNKNGSRLIRIDVSDICEEPLNPIYIRNFIISLLNEPSIYVGSRVDILKHSDSINYPRTYGSWYNKKKIIITKTILTYDLEYFISYHDNMFLITEDEYNSISKKYDDSFALNALNQRKLISAKIAVNLEKTIEHYKK